MIQKLIDTSANISNGGRAKLYWEGHDPRKFKNVPTSQKEVDLQDILQTFKLKGFEFGNWLSNEDRYRYVLATQKSLLDMALIFGTKNIGMDYSLGIAFGARGLQMASAHYEPWSNMINLTKKTGRFGSLAHEYGHAIDYVFGRHIDQNKKFGALSGGDSVAKKLKENTGGQLRFIVNEIVDIIKDSESYKRIKTKSEYWHRRTEIFARAFEQYISYCLISRTIVNKFIASDIESYYRGRAYLKKEDFKKVLPYFNELVKQISLFLRNKGKLVPTVPKNKVPATKTIAAPKATKKKITIPKVTNRKKAAAANK